MSSRFSYWFNWLIIGLVLLSATQVIAHDWYSLKCCSDSDCHPIASCAELLEQPDGSIKWEGYVFSPDKIQLSHDKDCHVCIHETTQWYNGTSHIEKKPMCVYNHLGS
jgi:hypothetical protein